MRKILIIMLIVFLMCSCIAENNDANEILFRGIPWGTSITDVLAIDDFYKAQWSNFKIDSAYAVECDTMGKSVRYYDGHVQCHVTLSSLINFNVAGYDVDSVIIYGAYTAGKDGFLASDTDHAKLYKACYRIKPKDFLEAEEDLITKLSALYGKADFMFPAYSYTENYHVWYGLNNTIVSLESDILSDRLTIWYATLDGNQYLQEAIDVLKAEEKAKAVNNFSGL